MEASISSSDPNSDTLALAVRGNRAALEEVARAWHGRIRRWALFELGHPGLAQDASQEALLRLIRNIHQYDPTRPFGPWLRTLVANCSKRFRGQQARHQHAELADHHITEVPGPERLIDARRQSAKAVSIFEKLSTRQREVMHLCTHQGQTAAEAARTLGIAPATARVLLHRARRTIRSQLQEAP